MHWYFLISSYYLTVSKGCSLTALKSIEVTQHSGSFKWGVHLPLVSTSFLYALVFPYIFLLFDRFEWALIDCIEKHRGHSVLWQFRMGGSICLWYLHLFSMSWYFLISSYYLTVSNGLSLTALKSVEVTQCSGSFEWGGWQIYPKSAKFELTCHLMLCFTEGLSVLHTKDLTR